MSKSMVILPGDLVAFNKLPDAEWFNVVSVDNNDLCVQQPRDVGMEVDYASQIIDRSLVKQHRSRGSITRVGWMVRVWLSEQTKWGAWTYSETSLRVQYPHLKIEEVETYVFGQLPT